MDRVAGAVEAWEQVQAMVGLEKATDRAVKAGRVWELARATMGKENPWLARPVFDHPL
ncbi:MAG: hypothetical protein ABI955_08695 [Nitrospirota bacterium]